MTPSPPPVPAGDLFATPQRTSLDPTGLLGVLRRQFWVILVSTVLALVVGAVVVSQITPRYTASALVQVDTATQQLTDAEEGSTSITTSTAFVAGQTDIITSDAVIRRTVRDLDLLSRPSFFPRRSGVERILAVVFGQGGEALSDQQRESEATHHLRSQLNASRIGLSFNIRVRYTAGSPDLAAEITNAIVASYVALQVEQKAESASRASEALAQRAQMIAANLVRLENEIADFVAAGLGQGQAQLSAEELEALNSSLFALTSERRSIERALVNTQVANDLGDFQSVNDALNMVAGQPSSPAPVTDLASELELLLQARVTSDDQAIAALDRRAAQLSTNAADVLTARLIAVRSQEDAQRARLRATIAGPGGAAGVELFRLQSEAESAREMYRIAIDLLNRVEIGGDVQVPDARAFSPATPPIEPSYPSAHLFLALAGVAGLSLGTGMAFLRDAYFTGFLSEAQIEHAVNLPVAATLPLAQNKEYPPQDEIIVRPISPFSEALRRWRLVVDSSTSKKPTTVLVTSAVSGEGKSVLSLSLARLCASSGNKTVLVDCDLRQPTIANLTGRAGRRHIQVDLFDQLSNGADTAIPPELVVEDPLSDVDLILSEGSGAIPSDDLFASRAFSKLHAQLQNTYDVIIFDSPPIVSVVDARILMRYADCVSLVVRWSATPPLHVHAAARDLLAPGAPPACAVLNMSQRSGHSYFSRNRTYGYGE